MDTDMTTRSTCPTSPRSRSSTTRAAARRSPPITRPTSTSPPATGRGVVLDTPTWRASRDWGARLGYDAVRMAGVNRAGVGLVRDVATRHA